MRAATDNNSVPKVLLIPRVGEFEIGAMLGEGGYGAVYEARKREDKNEKKEDKKSSNPPYGYVVKRIKKQYFNEEEVNKLNIIYRQTYSYELNDSVYIVFPRLPGKNLESLIREKNQNELSLLDFSARATVLFQLCSNLSDISSNYYIHRDIKSLNVLLDILVKKAGEYYATAAIIDLGLSIKVDGKNPNAIVNTGSIGGTFLYMAPEAFVNDFSLKSDIYSLTSVVADLLSAENVCLERRKILDKNYDYKTIHNELKNGAGHFDVSTILPPSVKGVPVLANNISIKQVIIDFLNRMQSFNIEDRADIAEVLSFFNNLKKVAIDSSDFPSIARMLLISKGLWGVKLKDALDEKSFALNSIDFDSDTKGFSCRALIDYYVLNQFKNYNDIFPLLLKMQSFKDFSSFLDKKEAEDNSYLFKLFYFIFFENSNHYDGIKYLKSLLAYRLRYRAEVYSSHFLLACPKLAFDIDLKKVCDSFNKKIKEKDLEGKYRIDDDTVISFFYNFSKLIFTIKSQSKNEEKMIKVITDSFYQSKILKRLVCNSNDQNIELKLNLQREIEVDCDYIDYLAEREKSSEIKLLINERDQRDKTFIKRLVQYLLEEPNKADSKCNYDGVKKAVVDYFNNHNYDHNILLYLTSTILFSDLKNELLSRATLNQQLKFFNILGDVDALRNKTVEADKHYELIAQLLLLSRGWNQPSLFIAGGAKGLVRLFDAKLIQPDDKQLFVNFFDEKESFQLKNINQFWQILSKDEDKKRECKLDADYLYHDEKVDIAKFINLKQKSDPSYLVNLWFYFEPFENRLCLKNNRLDKIMECIGDCFLSKITVKNEEVITLAEKLFKGKIDLEEFYSPANQSSRVRLEKLLPEEFFSRLKKTHDNQIKTKGKDFKK